ncbi:hypothetical protein RyT2_17550 [Pseudolactococcus yaeyamensis]
MTQIQVTDWQDFLIQSLNYKKRKYQTVDFSTSIIQHNPKVYYVFSKNSRLYLSEFTFYVLGQLSQHKSLVEILSFFSAEDPYTVLANLTKSIKLLQGNNLIRLEIE